jgi:DNA-binding NarL/FixJ family response regulator
MSIRVLVVDDQELVRDGFAMVLEHEDDIEVVGEAGTGAEAVEATRSHRPDVILMDIRMPEMDGLEATRRIMENAEWPVKVVILTTFDPDEYVYQALRAGASAFVLKDIPRAELVAAVRTVADGGALLAPSITKRLIGPATVKSHINSVFTKLGLRDRAQAVVFAYESGLVEPGEQDVGY